jgi:histone H2A
MTNLKSRFHRAELKFPVVRTHRFLSKTVNVERVGAGASIFLSALLEYWALKALELAGNTAKNKKKTKIIPTHLQLAIGKDEELKKLMSIVTISRNSVVPKSLELLLIKNKKSVEDSKVKTATPRPTKIRWIKEKYEFPE